MSRIFTFSNCRILLCLMACVTVVASTVSAQEAPVKHLSPAPAIPSEFLPTGQPFLALLDDVVVPSEPQAEGYFSFVAQCQLNAPAPNSTGSIATSSESEEGWAELLTYTCNHKECGDCSTLTFTNSPKGGESPSCSSPSSGIANCSGHKSCPVCVSKSNQLQSESFCEQVSKLLATTLNSSQASFEAKSNAIESALQMVADKTLADAQVQIKEIEAAHQKQISQLQEQLLATKDQNDSIDQIVSWLRPIYDNQNRNFEQIQQLAANRDGLSVENLRGEISNVQDRQLQDLPRLLPQTNIPVYRMDRSQLPSSARMASKVLSEKRNTEIASLKRELEIMSARLSKLVDQSVRPAGYLEPVYIPKGQLVPIPKAPKRHWATRNPDPARQPKSLR